MSNSRVAGPGAQNMDHLYRVERILVDRELVVTVDVVILAFNEGVKSWTNAL